MEEATVDCLIDADTRSWNVGMVDGIFAPQDTEVKKILVSSSCCRLYFGPNVTMHNLKHPSGPNVTMYNLKQPSGY